MDDVAGGGPAERALMKTAQREPDAIAIPGQQLEAGAVAIGEGVDGTITGRLGHALQVGGEAIHAPAHVDGLDAKEDLAGLDHVTFHWRSHWAQLCD